MSGYTEMDRWCVGKMLLLYDSKLRADKGVLKKIKTVYLTNPIPFVPNTDERVYVISVDGCDLHMRESNGRIALESLRKRYLKSVKTKKGV
jgi:hypothetical protein